MVHAVKQDVDGRDKPGHDSEDVVIPELSEIRAAAVKLTPDFVSLNPGYALLRAAISGRWPRPNSMARPRKYCYCNLHSFMSRHRRCKRVVFAALIRPQLMATWSMGRYFTGAATTN
jgi:hypothetical protein